MAREKSRLTNKISLTALCIAMTSQLILVSTTYAEDVGTIFDALSNRANSARAENARSAWARVSSSTTSCVQQHGISISAIVEAGVLPSDPRLKPIFAQCRAQLSGPSPESETGLRAPAIRSRQPKLIVGGLELGEIVDIQSEQFKPYHCTASKTIPNHTWCQRTVTGLGGESEFSATNMFLQSPDGSVAYVSQAIKPAHFSPGDIEAEIARLSRRYGTPRVLKSAPGQTPSGVIAYWGSLNLTPLDSDAMALIAAGHPSGKGFLFDFLNNFALSAQTGLDVYAPSEGRGYVWSASFDDSGTGVLRLTAIDSAAVGAPDGTGAVSSSASDPMPFTSKPEPKPASAPAPPAPPDPSSMASEAAAAPSRNNVETGFDVLAHLTELPPACADVEKLGPESTWPQGWTRETRDPFSNRYSPSDTCKKVMECLPSFAVRLNPIVDYLRPRPLLYAALKREAVTLPLMNMDLAIESLGYKIDQSVSDCTVSSLTLDRLMARSGADPGHSGIPAPFEYVQGAIRSLIADLRDKHNLEKSAYLEWTPYAKHYGRAKELDAAERRYEQAFTGPDLEILLQAVQALDEEMAKATAFQNMLAEQGKQLADLSERLAALAQRAGQQPLSKLVKPNTDAAITSLKAKVDDLGNIAASERGDASAKISEFTTTEDTIQDDVTDAQNRLDAMLRQGATLAELNNRLNDLAKRAGQNPISTFMKPGDLAAIQDLGATIARLAQAPVPERGDIADQITKIETRVAELRSDVADAEAKAAAIAKAAQEKAAAIAKAAQEKAAAAEAAKANADMQAKGLAYARDSGTTWAIKRIKNEMTDKVDTMAVSVQEPAPNVEAEITASCPDASGVIFSVVITDDNGKPTVTIPTDDENRISITVRKNDSQPLTWSVSSAKIEEGFFNKLAIGSMLLRPTAEQTEIQHKINQLEAGTSVDQVEQQLMLQFALLAVGGPTALDPDTVWRSMVQIDSSAGPLLLKIPLYADAIQKVISACRKS